MTKENQNMVRACFEGKPIVANGKYGFDEDGGKRKNIIIHMKILAHMAGSSQPQHFFAAGCILADFAITLIFYPIIKSL